MIAFPIAYAETHFGPKVIPNILRKAEPEIVLDVPHRVEPGHPLPVLLLVKDADRYPVRLLEVRVRARVTGHPPFQRVYDLGGERVDSRWYWKVLPVEIPEGQTGQASILPEVRARVGQTERTYAVDNYRKTSHEPFEVQIARDPLPYSPNWHAGDIHTHSHLTSDQVEFGVPWEPAVELARAQGLRWFAVTDHSYDLDDDPHDPLSNHAGLPKWRQLWEELDCLRPRLHDFAILPGEELSVGNARRRNVHLLILGSRRFFPGHGDSAERWFHTRPSCLLPEILEQVEPEALVAAAHPGASAPILEWLLLRRGKWTLRDLSHPRLDGLQGLNGAFDASFDRALALWRELLRHGLHPALLAGNDAHGNFGRFRQIGLPFLSMREHGRQLFGKVKTLVYLPGPIAGDGLLQRLKQRQAIITDGPFLEIRAKGSGTEEGLVGEEMAERPKVLYLHARSSPEFGYLREIRIWVGTVPDGETLGHTVRTNRPSYSLEAEIQLPPLRGPGYLRATLFTRERGDHFALTNPIWFP